MEKALGRCGTCKFWKVGTVIIYTESAMVFEGGKFYPSPDQGKVLFEDETLNGLGWCENLDHFESGIAYACGHDVDHNFYCKPEFGCVLYQEQDDPSDHIREWKF